MEEKYFEKFFLFFNSIYQIEIEILQEYYSQLDLLSIPPKTILTESGNIQKNMYFVLEGVQKSYQYSSEKAQIVEFTYFPSLSGIPDSFVLQTPSKYFLETVSQSLLLTISYNKHESFMAKYRKIETLFRKITEQILFMVIDRQYDLNALDMKSRFESLIRKRPELLYLVTRKDLASYLRIDPTNLSKLIKTVKL